MAWGVALLVITLNVYYAHRWLLRVSDSGTSPTYASTPFGWQLGKYLLIAAFAGSMWAWLWWRALPDRPWWRIPYQPTGGVAALFALFGAYGSLVILATMQGAPHVRELVPIIAAVPIVLLVPAGFVTVTSFNIYRRAGLLLVGYHAMFTAVQVFWYLAWGRLPALGHAGRLVRFGGGLDDPNGFGMMTVLPIVLVVTMWREFRRWQQAAGLLAVLAVMAFLTLSFTTAAALVAGLLALSAIMRRPRILVAVLGGALAAAVLALSSGYVRRVIDAKSPSALGRLDLRGRPGRPGLAEHVGDLNPVSLLFGSPRSKVVTEIGYVEVFANFGVLGLGVLVAVIVLSVRRGVWTARTARAAGDLTTARLYEGLSASLVAFAVGNLGVPYFGVVPVNLLFWLVAVLLAVGPPLPAVRPQG